MVRSDCSSSAVVIAGLEVRVPITRLSLAVLTELEIMSCCTLTNWASATCASTLIRRQRIESSLCLKKQIIIGQAAGAEFRCFECCFQSAQQTLEFCQQLPMLLTTALNALPGRQAEGIPRRLEWFTGDTAMNDRVPDEVHVQERPHVVAVRLFYSPTF